jgi:transposase-like protein
MEPSYTTQGAKKSRALVNRKPPVNPNFAAREQRFLHRFPDDRACLDYLLRLRFGPRFKCPKCDRIAKFHKIRQIPAYACQWCGYHLHPMAQTSFARSRIGLRVWFHAIFLLANWNNGMSARDLQRLLGLTYKTAWRMHAAINDARFHLRRVKKREHTVDFESLLATLAAPAPDKRPAGSGAKHRSAATSANNKKPAR